MTRLPRAEEGTQEAHDHQEQQEDFLRVIRGMFLKGGTGRRLLPSPGLSQRSGWEELGALQQWKSGGGGVWVEMSHRWVEQTGRPGCAGRQAPGTGG